MAYIGRQNLGGAYRQLDDISSSFNSSTTAFTMQVNSTNVSLGDVNQIVLSLGGVVQKPGTDFTISGSTLTFTTAPAAYTSFFAVLLGSDNGGTVTPTDGSVTTDKIAADQITKAKLADSIDIFAGTSLSAADLGAGVHIKTGDSGGSATSTADEIVVEGSGDMGIQLLGGASSSCGIAFGDSGDSNVGLITYDHANNRMRFKTNDTIHQTISSAGEVTQPLQPSFRVLSADMTNLQISQYHNIQYNSELFDIGSNFDTSTYTFTAPVTGKYVFSVQILLDNVDTAAGYYGVRLEASNHAYWDYLHSVKYSEDPAYFPISFTRVMDMDENDTAYVRIYQYQGSAQTDVNGGSSVWQGMLIS